MLVITSGCEQQNTEKQVQTTQSQQPKSAGYLRLPLKNPVKTLDPGWAYTPAQIEVVEQLFLGLTDFDPKTYEVIPQLATSWKANKNGTVYTFKLRQDVKWTDGKPVTAHDIAWTIWRNLALETELPYVFTLYLIKNAEALHKDSRKDIFPC
ncbi:Bacterial extracellular solute-binding protein, family 5 [Beggiatoa sp. PS]|nr:Bacterial extracellular solute-binding protein, family 5 [Beggiatoa sp. PS]